MCALDRRWHMNISSNEESNGDDHANAVRRLWPVCLAALWMLFVCITVCDREHQHSIHNSPAESQSHCADDFLNQNILIRLHAARAKDWANNVICTHIAHRQGVGKNEARSGIRKTASQRQRRRCRDLDRISVLSIVGCSPLSLFDFLVFVTYINTYVMYLFVW